MIKHQNYYKQLFPALAAVVVYETVAITVYANCSKNPGYCHFFVWIAMQAIAGVVLGYFSDAFSRRNALLGTHFAAMIFLPIALLQGTFTLWSLIALGLTYNPSPIIRALLVDNFPQRSKVKLIATTFVAQFLPWCFYTQLVSLTFIFLVQLLLCALLLLFPVVLFFLDDHRRPSAILKKLEFSHLIQDKTGTRTILYTLGALLAGQVVFFLSDTFFEESPASSVIFSALGIGSLVGTMLGMFYRQIPHLSLLTISYGMGFLMAFIPYISYQKLNLTNINLTYQLMLFSTLGGFYLPFVYDVVLAKVSSSHRGITCGIIDFIVAGAATIGLSIMALNKLHETSILLLSLILFLIALFTQKLGEKNVH